MNSSTSSRYRLLFTSTTGTRVNQGWLCWVANQADAAIDQADYRSQPVNHQSRQDSGQQAQRRQNEHRRQRIAVGFLRLSGGGERGRPRKVMPKALTKQAAASAADSASSAPTAGARNLSSHCGNSGLIRIA
jgi:hypothetical protein